LYTSLPETPQGVGDLIGLAFRMVRRNLGTIFRFILVPSIFTVAAGIAFQWVFTYGTAAISESRNITDALGLAGGFIVATILFCVSWWILGMRLLALTRVALGFSGSLEDAWQYMLKRKWALAGLYTLGLMLFTGAIMGWCILLVIGGFAGGMLGIGSEVAKVVVIGLSSTVCVLGMLITGCVYMLASHLAYCVLACEDTPVTAVIGRSVQLTMRHPMRTLAFGIVFLVTFSVISYPLSLPVAAATFVDALQHGLNTAATAGGASAYRPPMYLLVMTQAWEAAMGVILRPLVVFSFGLLYYDLRLRNEGMDIQRKLELIESRSG
jgi:hypothetical protein